MADRVEKKDGETLVEIKEVPATEISKEYSINELEVTLAEANKSVAAYLEKSNEYQALADKAQSLIDQAIALGIKRVVPTAEVNTDSFPLV